jgi:formylglycine-generating enzyme
VTGSAEDPTALVRDAERLVASGDRPAAAALYDRAYGLAPHDQQTVAARRQLLDELAVDEHGLHFRYIPAGPRLIGSDEGDPDERPVHSVTLPGFWLTDTPVSWADFCRILGWSEPPEGMPPNPPKSADKPGPMFYLYEANKIRLQYCEDETIRAHDWHAHAGMAELFGPVIRLRADSPHRYGVKPMVSVAWQEAEEMAAAMATPNVTYRLPTEAEWEAAARGGLVGARYAWGDEPPTVDICDFGRFEQFSIMPPRILPPNGYSLYGMCGGVWEWTADWYDALAYTNSPADQDIRTEKVVRGGSWTDCAEVVTVSFRASRESSSWREGNWGRQRTPNIGFRLCRAAP